MLKRGVRSNFLLLNLFLVLKKAPGPYFLKNLYAVCFRSAHIKFIDVWPVNFFEPGEEDPFGTTGLFMLQLACIINMVSTRIIHQDNNP
jgi:hypothetical protein